MKYRKLRIAWSMLWGVACLLLIALWVRSYRWRDTYSGPSRSSGVTFFFSERGEVQYLWDGRIAPDGPWEFKALPVPKPYISLSKGLGYLYFAPDVASIVVPYWSTLLLTSSFAFVSWIPWRFNLRTLLFAMALVALGLGLAVYALRK